MLNSQSHSRVRSYLLHQSKSNDVSGQKRIGRDSSSERGTVASYGPGAKIHIDLVHSAQVVASPRTKCTLNYEIPDFAAHVFNWADVSQDKSPWATRKYFCTCNESAIVQLITNSRARFSDLLQYLALFPQTQGLPLHWQE
jgi:hypothetical protein